MPIISLTTDFGLSDEYVGLMKAAILKVDASATIVDLTHGIDAQDIRQAAFVIGTGFRHFPEGTVHVVVVDPGVGTERDIVALERNGHCFIAPDNGVLSLVLEGGPYGRCVRVENAACCSPRPSATFHGRDIMAPAAAHLGRGMPLERLGPPVAEEGLVRLDDLRSRREGADRLAGIIVAADRFGNLITNIAAGELEAVGAFAGARVWAAGGDELPLLTRYADVPPGQPLALVGSRGYMELAVNCGSAAELLGAAKGDWVRVAAVDGEPNR